MCALTRLSTQTQGTLSVACCTRKTKRVGSTTHCLVSVCDTRVNCSSSQDATSAKKTRRVIRSPCSCSLIYKIVMLDLKIQARSSRPTPATLRLQSSNARSKTRVSRNSIHGNCESYLDAVVFITYHRCTNRLSGNISSFVSFGRLI